MNNNPSGNGNHSSCDRANFVSQEMVFVATLDAEKFDDDIWICNSIVSSHFLMWIYMMVVYYFQARICMTYISKTQL
jgi:hypothetical protein